MEEDLEGAVEEDPKDHEVTLQQIAPSLPQPHMSTLADAHFSTSGDTNTNGPCGTFFHMFFGIISI